MRVSGALCFVLVVKPIAGTAETRHTASAPKRTDTWPPVDSKLCVPAPPEQSGGRWLLGAGGAGVVVRSAGAVVAGRVADGDTVGLRVCVGGLGVAVGAPITTELGESVTIPAATSRALGGSGAVEPTTKRTVSDTAVTVRTVHDSQIRK
ncbi:hypothetical protein [Actinacidiphila alni]|uniref:hypothetical protein n=1 Tax=Actinacidiphila alni TaxID=380248 RepID=UPI003453A6C6